MGKDTADTSGKRNTAIIVALIGLIGTVITALIGIAPELKCMFVDCSTPVAIEEQASVDTSPAESESVDAVVSPEPSEELEPAEVVAEEEDKEEEPESPQPLPDVLVDDAGITMQLIPSGSFLMGTFAEEAFRQCKQYVDGCEISWVEDESPPHTVVLSDYYLDRTEVTNAMYRACVNAGKCQPPKNNTSSTGREYYGNAQYDGYPVMNITWQMAETYCKWRGGRLPTEAEWEKAARGSGGSVFPWGNDFVYDAANYCDVNCSSVLPQHQDDGYEDTSLVGLYAHGVSYYGVYDMAGNVWEWVADFYQGNYYISLPDNVVDPQGPPSGGGHVLRGGSANTPIHQLRSSARVGANYLDYSDHYVGFRCAKDAP